MIILFNTYNYYIIHTDLVNVCVWPDDPRKTITTTAFVNIVHKIYLKKISP